jgi:hypothetical protein
VHVGDRVRPCWHQDGATEPDLAWRSKNRIVLARCSVDTIKSDQGDNHQQAGCQAVHDRSQRITACKRFGDPSQ